MQPYFTERDAKQTAINYAKGRTAHRYGGIRVFNAAGELEQTIPFGDQTAQQLI